MIDIKLFVHVYQETNPGKSGWCALLRAGKHERRITGSRHGVYPEVALHAISQAVARLSRPSHLYIYTRPDCVAWMGGRYRLADVYGECVEDMQQQVSDGHHQITWIVKTDDPLARVAADAAKGAL